MIFWQLNAKHKRNFLINQAAVIIALIVCLIISWNINKIELPTNIEKLGSSLGFVTTTSVFVLAVMNRISGLFRIKSLGFAFMFLMFIGVRFIIDPVIWTVGLMTIPLFIDDIVFRPYWNNIWYNQYHGVVKISGKA